MHPPERMRINQKQYRIYWESTNGQHQTAAKKHFQSPVVPVAFHHTIPNSPSDARNRPPEADFWPRPTGRSFATWPPQLGPRKRSTPRCNSNRIFDEIGPSALHKGANTRRSRERPEAASRCRLWTNQRSRNVGTAKSGSRKGRETADGGWWRRMWRLGILSGPAI